MQREVVAQAAVSLFAAKGFAATGIRELGRAAGLNSATLYHYVHSKEDLLVEIVRGCLTAVNDGTAAALRASADPLFQLAGVVAFHVGLSAVNPLTVRVAEYEMRSLTAEPLLQMQALRDEIAAMTAQVIERGVRTGRFQVTDEALAKLAILELSSSVAHWYREDGRLGVAEVQDHFVRLTCRIVGAGEAEVEGRVFAAEIPRLVSEPAVATEEIA